MQQKTTRTLLALHPRLFRDAAPVLVDVVAEGVAPAPPVVVALVGAGAFARSEDLWIKIPIPSIATPIEDTISSLAKVVVTVDSGAVPVGTRSSPVTVFPPPAIHVPFTVP